MSEPQYREPYEGSDMISYIMDAGFTLVGRYGKIKSMTNVRNTAIIVTEFGVFRARPDYTTGFCVELLVYL